MTYTDGAAVTMFSPKHPHTEMSFKHISSPMMKHRHLQLLAEKIHPVPQIFFPYSQRREREAQHVFHTGQSYFSQTKASFLLVSECVLGLNFPVIAVKFMGTALVTFSSLPAGKQGRCLAVGAGVRGNVFVLFCVMINPSAVPRISAG